MSAGAAEQQTSDVFDRNQKEFWASFCALFRRVGKMFTACMAGGETHPPQCHFMPAVILRVDMYNFAHFIRRGRSKTCSEGSAKKKVAHLPKNVRKNTHICLKRSAEPKLWVRLCARAKLTAGGRR